jgi:glycerate 2-kinase
VIAPHQRGKDAARWIFHRTLAAVEIRSALARKIERRGHLLSCAARTLDLRSFREIVVIAIGKAAVPMARALGELLAPDFSADGILSAPVAWARPLPGWTSFVGGHPVPTEASFAAGRAILARLRRCDEKSLVIFLLSGGGSALVEWPLDADVTLGDFRQLHHALVTCGAPIGDINAVRKHLSATKGGRLAAAAPRSPKFTFGISDVPEGQESALASGPTLPDPSRVADAVRVVREYRLLEKFPPAIRRKFETGALLESPKPGDPAFSSAFFELLLGAHDLLHSAHRAAEALGYAAFCDNSTDNWPLEKAADFLLAQLSRARSAGSQKCLALIADGEVSSPVTGDGLGGRNSAFVLACAARIAGQPVTVLSAGTDGVDGNSPAAGAVADGATLGRARERGLDPADFLRRSDAYSFFRLLGDAVETGPTGNNLRDLRVFLLD